MSPPASHWVIAIALASIALPLTAQSVYKIKNPDGTVSYTDRKPASLDGVQVIRARAENQSLVNLRVDGDGIRRQAVASNLIDGPLQIELQLQGAVNVASEPALPLRVVLPAHSTRTLATIQHADPRQPARFGVAMRAVPGDPAARPDDTVYLLPLDTRAWRIDQGYGGAFSHNDAASRHAVDFAVAEGTPVLAAREGVVMQVEAHFDGAGLDREKYGSRANHIRILHGDGTMAVYAHLQPDSVLVRPGARVRRGQHIGNSGNTGFSTGPHLHFAVQVNRDMELVSVPFRLEGPGGTVSIPGAP